MTQDGQKEGSGYTLYWEAMSGAMAVEFALEEMGVPYRLRAVDMASGEHRSAEYLKPNPTGQVPALALPDGSVIGESAAIILTLGDRHPESSLVPGTDTDERPCPVRRRNVVGGSDAVVVEANLYGCFLTGLAVAWKSRWPGGGGPLSWVCSPSTCLSRFTHSILMESST